MLSLSLMRQQSRCLRQVLALSTRQSSSSSSSSPLVAASVAGINKSWSKSLVPHVGLSTTVAKPMSGHGDHAKMWTVEKVVSLAQIPAFVIPFMWTNPMTDAVFCTLAVLHAHWGVEGLAIDYIRPILFGGSTVIPNLCQGLVWVCSVLALGGLYYFNYTDVGFVNAVKMLWD